jgi:hypothetical protein
MSRWRILVTLVALPLFDAVLGYAAFPMMYRLGNHGAFRLASPEQVSFNFGVMAGVLGFVIMITLALPAASWLTRSGRTSVRHFAFVGTVLGNLPFAFYLYIALVFTVVHLVQGTLGEHLSPMSELLAGGVRAILLGSFIGGASGIVFWLIAIRTTTT